MADSVQHGLQTQLHQLSTTMQQLQETQQQVGNTLLRLQETQRQLQHEVVMVLQDVPEHITSRTLALQHELEQEVARVHNVQQQIRLVQLQVLQAQQLTDKRLLGLEVQAAYRGSSSSSSSWCESSFQVPCTPGRALRLMRLF